MKLFSKIKFKILSFFIKRRAKKILKQVDKIQTNRINDFSKVDKDINSFWFCSK